LLDGDHAVAQQVVAQMETNTLTTFTTLALQEEKKQQEDKKETALASKDEKKDAKAADAIGVNNTCSK
jgi:hypothetical protein